jgi:hypothetical protein
MKKQPEYTYERDSTVWAVIRWRKCESGNGYIGEKISTYMLREDARKEVYRLNGWKDMRLDFSYNWNSKLNGKAFTSIRLWNENKYEVGNVYEIRLGNTKKGIARLVSLKRIRLDQINDHIALLDTGYRANECREMIKTMYKNKRIDWDNQYLAYCLFEYVESKNDLFNN